MLYRLYKQPDEEWYYESDDEGIVYRQILKENGQKPKLSNQRESQFHLAEGEIELEDSTLITLQKKDFEKEWTTLNAEYMSDWEVVKKDNKVGKEVNIIGYDESNGWIKLNHARIRSINCFNSVILQDFINEMGCLDGQNSMPLLQIFHDRK